MQKIQARLLLKHQSKSEADDASRALENCGFGVLQRSETAVRFEGAVDLFERVFKVSVDTDGEQIRLRGVPRLPEVLAGSAESVYVPTPPEYF